MNLSGTAWRQRTVLVTGCSGSYCSSWNIGPNENVVPTVEDVVRGILRRWPGGTRLVVERDQSLRESKLLRLDCTKANRELKWRAAWGIERTLDAIVAWYRHFYDRDFEDMYAFTTRQIEEYRNSALEKGIAWASGAL